MPVVVEDEVLHEAHIAPEDFRSELAVMLYASGRLPLGKAAQTAGMNRLDFQKLLGERRISRGPTVEEFQREVAGLRELGLL